MTELELIIDLHLKSDRQGPGSQQDTLRALSFTNLEGKKNLEIADLGSGNGGQSITLAQHLHGQITALDLFPDFIEELNSRVSRSNLKANVKGKVGSMEELPFDNNSLDLIWSEGAIYNMGFEKGIKYWHQFLKPGGYLAVSEITWITENRPSEIQEFWESNYPEIANASTKINQMEENGYTLSGYFYLSPDSWTKNYYEPIEESFSDFLKKHNDSEEAKSVVKEYQDEIALFNKFQDYYSYGFYVARKN